MANNRPVGRPNIAKERLTESDVVDLAKSGVTNPQIAKEYGISVTSLKMNFGPALKHGRNARIIKAKKELDKHAFELGSIRALELILRMAVPEEINAHLYDDKGKKKSPEFQAVTLTQDQLLELGRKLRESK